MAITSTISPALKFGLYFFGFWPGVSYSTINLLSFMSVMLIIQYFQYLYIFDHLNIRELSNLVDSLTMTMCYSFTFLEVTSLWIHRRVLHKILADMVNDWQECINVDQNLYMVTNKAKLSHFFSNVLLSFNTIVAAFYFVGDAIRIAFLIENYNDTIRQLPIKIQLPFEIQQSPIFEFMSVTIFLHVMLQVWIVAILNGLFLTLVLHVSGLIDIICQEFKSISKSTICYGSSIPSLGMLIKRHNRVISHSENIEQLFSFITLMQIVRNTIVICFLGFIFIISLHSESGIFVLMKIVFAYISMTMEAFIICFAGEYLTHKGKLIVSATYGTLWYDMPTNQNKIIMFIIMRSQKELVITAGKIINISFETFMSIMKASASYISVLIAIY